MSSHRSFLSLALTGEALANQIDDYIDQWHDDPRGLPLHDYLGMTGEEYGLWLDSPDFLPLIIAGRKLHKPLDAIATDTLQTMRLAGSPDDARKLQLLQAWLQRSAAQ
jgi:hypothetical protein